MEFSDFSEEAAPQNFCGGPLGCSGRTCDPKMKDCQECLKDVYEAMNYTPTPEEQEETNWYWKNFGGPEAYKSDEPPLFDI